MILKKKDMSHLFFGQKSYNGVAILAKGNIEDVQRGIPGFEDEAARYIEAVIDGTVRVASVYVPNGQEVGSEKFEYKQKFFKALNDHAINQLQLEEAFVIGGDYNVALEEKDVYDPAHMEGKLHFSTPERQWMRTLLNSGMVDMYRVSEPGAHHFSWWDYRAGSWQKDNGLRIDYLLASPQAVDRMETAGIDKTPRGWEKPSDHTPVWCKLAA